MKRGLSQRNLYGYNPLPKGHTEEALFKTAGLELMEASVIDPFYFSMKYAGGLDAEMIRLHPGDTIVLREGTETKDFMTALKELGAVLVADINDEVEVLTESIRGLRVAEKFYRERGEIRVKKMMRERGLSKNEADEYKYDYWVYFYNQAKANVLKKTLLDTQKKLEAAKKRTAASDLGAPLAADPQESH